VTVPVGATLPETGVTVAVTVRLVPATELVDDAVSVVVVAIGGVVTAIVTAAEVDVL
jgi:hypothetical protein